MISIPLKYRLARFIGHQHYIRRGRDRVIRLLLAHSDPAPSICFSVDFFGYIYSGDLSNYVDWSVYLYGAYSNNELQLLRDIVHALRADIQHITFYDVGANVGQHTLFLSKYVDDVMSFEPFELVRKQLFAKLDENKIRNVRVFPIGLGAQDEELAFYSPTAENLGTGSFRGPADVNPRLRLPVREGDTFVAKNDLPRIDIMKVDVEGFESAVFQGLRKRLRRDRPVIMTEISGTDRSGFGSLDGFVDAMYEDFELYSVGCTSISGTYRITRPSFDLDGEFLIIPKERIEHLKGILPRS